MSSAGNFNPQWGYVAPAPNLMRTVRIVLVALAVGASAGAGAVVSLVDRSNGDQQSSVASRTLARSADTGLVPSRQMPPVAAAAVAPTTSPAGRDPSEKSPPEGQDNTAKPSMPIRLSKIDVPATVAAPTAAAPAETKAATDPPATDAPLPQASAQPTASDPPAAVAAAPTQVQKKSAARKHHSISRYASRGDSGSWYGPDDPRMFDGGRGHYREQRWGGFFPGGNYGFR